MIFRKIKRVIGGWFGSPNPDIRYGLRNVFYGKRRDLVHLLMHFRRSLTRLRSPLSWRQSSVRFSRADKISPRAHIAVFSGGFFSIFYFVFFVILSGSTFTIICTWILNARCVAHRFSNKHRTGNNAYFSITDERFDKNIVIFFFVSLHAGRVRKTARQTRKKKKKITYTCK